MPYEIEIQAQGLRLSAILKRQFWIVASKLQNKGERGVKFRTRHLLTLLKKQISQRRAYDFVRGNAAQLIEAFSEYPGRQFQLIVATTGAN